MEFLCPKDRAKTMALVSVCLNLGTILHTIAIHFIPHWVWITVLNTASVVPLILILRSVNKIVSGLHWIRF